MGELGPGGSGSETVSLDEGALGGISQQARRQSRSQQPAPPPGAGKGWAPIGRDARSISESRLGLGEPPGRVAPVP